MFFPGFTTQDFTVNGTTIHAVHGGNRAGRALLLLHGHPQTHVIWHHIAPKLAEKFYVVAADLRGYGDSAKPAGLPDHANYSKRVMAQDQVGVMQSLGFKQFLLCAHDRETRAAGGKVKCPLQVYWGAEGVIERCFNALSIWKEYAENVGGSAFPSGHYIPEQVPELLFTELQTFFG